MPSATLWLLDGSRVAEEDVAFFVQQLGESEAHRYICFKRKERQRQFLLGRMLLRFAVSSLISIPLDALAIIERESNAPQLVLSNLPYLQPAFSISHSRDWVACVVSSNASLGMDIEAEDPARDIVGISQSAFHPSDHLWLLRQSETARLAAFYHLWCTREALYKLMSSLGSETVLSPLVGANGAFASQGPGWHRYTLAHSFLRVAVCSDRPLAAIHKVELTRLARCRVAGSRTRVSINKRGNITAQTWKQRGWLNLSFIKEARGQISSLMGRAPSAADGGRHLKIRPLVPLASLRSLHGFTLVPLRIFS